MTQKTGIKIDPDTKEKIRLAAAVADLQQGQLVQRAIDEYVARHSEELQQGIDRARAALLDGRAATLAHLLGEDPADVAAVMGAGEAGLTQRR